ncbi:hypothetical protein M0638_06540 [Roseomonas sp. NAR14]|uniref:Uncharacterized protein n=1 Tax=Roseomonas acroporae TaxID=2937791 RepID=A0A9X1Y8I3_9PROT|nr:hypothetical protein [Roseomonas acroporae]MCK8784037.1 hypothetical protein [Roseomonas acroporae]
MVSIAYTTSQGIVMNNQGLPILPLLTLCDSDGRILQPGRLVAGGALGRPQAGPLRGGGPIGIGGQRQMVDTALAAAPQAAER